MEVDSGTAHSYRLLASPMSSVLSPCCTNTSGRLLRCTPSMVDSPTRAKSCMSGVSKLRMNMAHLSGCHQLFWLVPLRSLRLGVVVVDAAILVSGFLPQAGRRDTVHYDCCKVIPVSDPLLQAQEQYGLLQCGLQVLWVQRNYAKQKQSLDFTSRWSSVKVYADSPAMSSSIVLKWTTLHLSPRHVLCEFFFTVLGSDAIYEHRELVSNLPAQPWRQN